MSIPVYGTHGQTVVYIVRSNDMVNVGHVRNSAAKYAGQVLYQGGTGPNPQENINNHRVINQDAEELWVPNSGKISAVRRTFLLLTVFDVGLTFILWVIYTQLLGDGSGWDTFKKQVSGYTFKTSLFDTVMLCFIRFTLLNLAYALFRLRHWWTVALTTLLTSVFLIVKIFEFQFTQQASAKNPLSYCLLIVSFVLAWVETWFLDFKVIPQEKKDIERQKLLSGVIVSSDERAPLLGGANRHGQHTPGDEYYSPIESPAGSDDEDYIGDRERFYSDANSRSTSRPQSSTGSLGKEPDYISLGLRAWDVLWEMVSQDAIEWKLDAGRDMVDGCVYQANIDGIGKMFKLQCIVDLNAKDLWYEVVHEAPSAPDWNPTVIENRILCVVDDNTDVCYSIAAEGGGGLISSRDFVSVRRFGCREGVYLSAGISTTHPDMPVQKKYVRGENVPGGWVFKPCDNPEQSIFSWYLNTNLKGWLPQKLVDQAIASVLLEYVVYLRKRVVELKQQR